jgi:hypothetical protein
MKKQENRRENRVNKPEFDQGQLGGTKAYALVAILVLFLLVHAGYNYLPVVYQYENFKSEMKGATMRVLTMPHGAESLSDKLKKQIRLAGNENGVPANAVIEVTEVNNSLKARVKFMKEVNLLPFGLYRYRYEFDNTSVA